MHTQVTNKSYTPFHIFCCSLIKLNTTDENRQKKREIQKTHPDIKFFGDISYDEQMGLLTQEVLKTIYHTVKKIYKKHSINRVNFGSKKSFFNTFCTDDEFGLFTMMQIGLPIKMVVDLTKIDGYVLVCIRNNAQKIAMRYPRTIPLPDMDIFHNVNHTYDLCHIPLNPEEELEEQEKSNIHDKLKILPSHTHLEPIINFSSDMKTKKSSMFFSLLLKMGTLLNQDIPESHLPSTINKFLPFIMLHQPKLFHLSLSSLIEKQHVFLRPKTEIISLWQETTEIRNNIKSKNPTLGDIEKDYRNFLTWLCYSTTETYDKDIKYPQVHRDTFGKNALRCNGDICIGILISLIIGMIEPDIFSCHFDYPFEYKQMLAKMFAKVKISLSLKDVTEQEFLSRVKYFHTLLRKSKYTEALIRLEKVIFKTHMQIDTNSNFQSMFEKNKSAIKRLQKTDADVERLLLELTRIFYCKDNQQYDDFLNQITSSTVTRFLTKYLQFMSCLIH